MSELQSQCWICPECFDDSHHQPGDKYCRVKQRNAELEQVVSDMDQEDIEFVQAHDCGAGMLLAMKDKAIAELQSLCSEQDEEISELRIRIDSPANTVTDNSAVIERLEARCERLREALEYAAKPLDRGLRTGEFEFPEVFCYIRNVLKETPAQSLREIRAEAGREGFIKGCLQFAAQNTTASAAQIAANEYADQIRRGEDER